MSTVRELVDAVVETITNATGLQGYNHIPESVSTEAFVVSPRSVEVVTFALGEVEITLDCAVLIPSSDAQSAQMSAYDYMAITGMKSITKAVYDNQSFGLTDTSSGVQRMRLFSMDEIAAYHYYGVMHEILVVTRGA